MVLILPACPFLVLKNKDPILSSLPFLSLPYPCFATPFPPGGRGGREGKDRVLRQDTGKDRVLIFFFFYKKGAGRLGDSIRTARINKKNIFFYYSLSL